MDNIRKKSYFKKFLGSIFILMVSIFSVIAFFFAKEEIKNIKFIAIKNSIKSKTQFDNLPVQVRDINKQFVLSKKGDFYYIAPFEEHFSISGFPYMQDNDSLFYRLKEEDDNLYSMGVRSRANFTSGGRIRFKTNSSKIYINVVLDKLESYPYFALTGSAGIDVYIGSGKEKKWCATIGPHNRWDKNYSGEIELSNSNMNEITINMPLYSSIKRIEIGVEKDAFIDYPKQYNYEKPIVFYGSSITQGCSTSRPGTNYPELVTRWLDANLVNLGFSSSAKGEREIAKYIAGLDMTAFIMEYDHNADSVKDLKDTHYKFYSEIRVQNPELPIILLSRFSEGFSISKEEAEARRKVIEETYNRALAEGDSNIYYINGSNIFVNEIRDSCLVDGKHPNDRGMYIIADILYTYLNKALDAK